MVEIVDQVVPKKRKRFNKNRKKAWRKRTNISEVEEALDDERREERFGGPLEEKRDTELLFLDLGDGSSEVQSMDEECRLEFSLDEVPEEPGGSGVQKNVGLKPSRKKGQAKTLKSHQFISGLQGAKPPHKPQSKQNTVSVAKKKKAVLQMKDPKLTKKFKQIAKQIEDDKKNVNGPTVIIRRKFESDLWSKRADDISMECIKKGLEDSFIKDISDYYGTQRKQRSIKVPKCRYVEVSKLSAVEIPKAGTSYNPAYDDHQHLMQEAVLQEEKRLKKNERIEGATTRFFPTIDKAPSESTWLAEMSQGLPKTGDEALEDDKDEMDDKEQMTVTSKAKNEKKTKKQRKKEQKQKMIKLKRLQEKQNRVRGSDVFRVKMYLKEIDESEKLTKKRIDGRIARKEQLKSIPHRLGRLRFEEEDVQVNLGDELPDSLRQITPTMNPIEERFKNLQRRNLIEPRLPHKMQRKYKLKKTVKRSYKMEFEKILQMSDLVSE